MHLAGLVEWVRLVGALMEEGGCMGEVECLGKKWRRGVDKITGFKVCVNGGLWREMGG